MPTKLTPAYLIELLRQYPWDPSFRDPTVAVYEYYREELEPLLLDAKRLPFETFGRRLTYLAQKYPGVIELTADGIHIANPDAFMAIKPRKDKRLPPAPPRPPKEMFVHIADERHEDTGFELLGDELDRNPVASLRFLLTVLYPESRHGRLLQWRHVDFEKCLIHVAPGVALGISDELRAVLVDLKYDFGAAPQDRLFGTLPYLTVSDREEMRRGFSEIVQKQVVRSRAAA